MKGLIPACIVELAATASSEVGLGLASVDRSGWGNPACWEDEGYNWNVCCHETLGENGNENCWMAPFTYDLCCTHSDVESMLGGSDHDGSVGVSSSNALAGDGDRSIAAQEGLLQGNAFCWEDVGYTYSSCCDGAKYGPSGNSDCWDVHFSKQLCCDIEGFFVPDNVPTSQNGAVMAMSSRLPSAPAGCWDNVLRMIEEYSSTNMTVEEKRRADAMVQDDNNLRAYCCERFHVQECWGDAPMFFDAASNRMLEISPMYAKCCLPSMPQLLSAPTPQWAKDQIEKDMLPHVMDPSNSTPDMLANYRTGEGADIIIKTEQGRKEGHMYRFCHFRIRDNVIDHCTHLDDQEHTAEVYRSVVHALYILKEFVRLPDVDFIMSTSEIERHSVNLPVFAHTKMNDAEGVIRMPMWEYMTFWVVTNLNKVDRTLPFVTWSKKQSKIFWRGSATGGWTCDSDVLNQNAKCEHLKGWTTDDWDRYPRTRIVQLSKFWNEGVDARFTDSVNPELQETFSKRGMLAAKHVKLGDQLGYKYLIDMDGSTQSNRLFWVLASNSALFRVGTKIVSWFSDLLQPYVHYVPIRSDMSDIVGQVKWAQENDALVERIALSGREFALERLTQEHSINYFYRMLLRLSDLQKPFRH
jgi:hypothetical protein